MPTCWITDGSKRTDKTNCRGSHAPALVLIHQSIEERHFDMDTGMADSDVGRNKSVRVTARTGVSGKCLSNSPETPPRATRLDGLIPAYFEMCIKTSALSWEPLVDGTLQRPASPERCKQHSHGGHDIPADAIARRFPRSLYNFFQLFSPIVDQAYCFMNNDNVPTLVFQQNAGQRQMLHHEFFELLQQEAQR